MVIFVAVIGSAVEVYCVLQTDMFVLTRFWNWKSVGLCLNSVCGVATIDQPHLSRLGLHAGNQ